MEVVKHETCQQYIARRLSEGWRTAGSWKHLIFLSPPEGNFIRVVDLRNDIETLRPNATGDENAITTQYPADSFPATDHWNKVDEEVSDEDSTYITTSATLYERDLYNIVDHSVGSGTINFIKVYAVLRDLYGPSQVSLKIAIKAGTGTGDPDTVDESAEKMITTSWASYDNTWTENPSNPGNAFTWDEIDRLQIGVAMRRANIYVGNRCTQVYVEVDYTVGVETKTKTYTLAARLKKTQAKTYSFAGRLFKVQTKSYTAAARLLKTQEKTYTLAAKLTSRLTKTYSLEARLFKAQTKEYTLTARLIKTATKAYTLGVRLFKTQTKGYTLAARLKKTRAETYTLAAKLVSWVTKTYTLAARLLKTQRRPYSLAARLFRTEVKTYTLGAYLISYIDWQQNQQLDMLKKTTLEGFKALEEAVEPKAHFRI